MVLIIGKPLEKITEGDLEGLIENQFIEKKQIEYKRSLPSNRDSDKKEFLADIVSFANTSGGDIIYGVAQDNETGYPTELLGVDISNSDQEILRLESIIRDGIEPRIIPQVITHNMQLSNSKSIIIIRIKKSWLSPHRVKFKGDHRFYARATNGKYELDVGELRNAFIVRENISNKIQKFLENRLSSIFANETPIPFNDGPKLVLHLIPLIAFNPSVGYDIDSIIRKYDYIGPINGTSLDSRYNLEGFLVHTINRLGRSYSYTQIYRNGIIEAVDALELRTDQQIIPSTAYELTIIKSVSKYLSALNFLSVELPVAIFVTLMGLKGYSMATVRFHEGESRKIEHDILKLPEVMVETYNVNPEIVLKPLFDVVWNACGFPKSLNYNEEGEWNPERRDYRR